MNLKNMKLKLRKNNVLKVRLNRPKTNLNYLRKNKVTVNNSNIFLSPEIRILKNIPNMLNPKKKAKRKEKKGNSKTFCLMRFQNPIRTIPRQVFFQREQQGRIIDLTTLFTNLLTETKKRGIMFFLSKPMLWTKIKAFPNTIYIRS